MSAPNIFDKGSIVMLKSGSPKMVVAGCSGGNHYCKWFDKATSCKDWFGYDELMLYPIDGKIIYVSKEWP